jgi:cytochrome bd ubiquinol oxidase subunit I
VDAILLARLQFALTAGFHFIFPPLTIGLSAILAVMLGLRAFGKDPAYDGIARFWTKLFAINFALGVATGIVMEFQFGTNWSAYSRFVGDIFGAPLAAEGVLAFFLESCFLGLLLFGWNRLSKRAHFVAGLMVCFGSWLSALWIIVANSWQQTPSGYTLVRDASGKVIKAQLTDFMGAVFSPSMPPRYLHVLAAAVVTGAFFVAGVSAWYLLKGRHRDFALKSLRIALAAAFLGTLASAAIGDWHARQVALTQPEKFAAMEALFKTQKGAPLLILGYPLPDFGLPKALSFMVYFDWNAEVTGLDAFPANEVPPVALTAVSFHAMVWPGFFLLLVAFLGMAFIRVGGVEKRRWFLRLLVLLIPLPFLVNEFGWITAEVGRQPWIVYHLLKTSDAVSVVVPAWQILVSILLFTSLYTVLACFGFFLLKREIAHGPAETAAREREVAP